MPPNRRITQHTGTETNGGAATIFTVQLPEASTDVLLLRIIFQRTAGTAANYTLLGGDKAAFTDDAADGRVFAFAITTVATDTDHLFDPPIPITTDANGQVHLMAQWDAGADNDATAIAVVEQV